MKKLILFLSILLLNLVSFAQSRHISSTTKRIVFTRDGGMCKCCGSSQLLEYDHIIPFSCGGRGDPSNVQLLCRRCNRSKSNGCFCKVHDKQVGYNCCDGKKTSSGTGGSVGRSSGEATQCTGTTQKGARCRNKTTSSSGRCHYHD